MIVGVHGCLRTDATRPDGDGDGVSADTCVVGAWCCAIDTYIPTTPETSDWRELFAGWELVDLRCRGLDVPPWQAVMRVCAAVPPTISRWCRTGMELVKVIKK